jgi:hypothetical protein
MNYLYFNELNEALGTVLTQNLLRENSTTSNIHFLSSVICGVD